MQLASVHEQHVAALEDVHKSELEDLESVHADRHQAFEVLEAAQAQNDGKHEAALEKLKESQAKVQEWEEMHRQTREEHELHMEQVSFSIGCVPSFDPFFLLGSHPLPLFIFELQDPRGAQGDFAKAGAGRAGTGPQSHS